MIIIYMHSCNIQSVQKMYNLFRFFYKVCQSKAILLFTISEGFQLQDGNSLDPSKIREILLCNLPMTAATILVGISSTAFIKPENTNFIYSVFPFKNKVSYIVFGLFEAFTLFKVYTAAMFVFFFVSYYTFSTKYWLKRIIQLR